MGLNEFNSINANDILGKFSIDINGKSAEDQLKNLKKVKADVEAATKLFEEDKENMPDGAKDKLTELLTKLEGVKQKVKKTIEDNGGKIEDVSEEKEEDKKEGED